MGKLREKHLLWTAFKFVLIPLISMATLGSFFPFMSALVPAHESDVCICLYFWEDSARGGNRYFPILSNLSTRVSMNLLVSLNQASFYAVNWSFLIVNIVAIFKIRKMRDRLDIRKELTWAVALWSFFDFFQYVFYFLTQMSTCPPKSEFLQHLIIYAPLYSYVVIIVRDFLVHCVMVFFIIRVNKRESNIQAELAKGDTMHDL